MKTVHLAAGLLAGALGIAGLAAPGVAQEAASAAPIVVSAKHQSHWNRGSALEVEGLKALEKAERDRVRASADIVNAQNRSQSSDARATNAADEFRRLTASSPSYADPRDALRWANSVQRAAENWAQFQKRGNKGANAIDQASREQRKAEDAVRKAQERIDRGRAMKAEAERRSLLGA